MLLLSSSSTSCPKYDVFLSFRGFDTRNNFTDHLHSALQRMGIVTFRDDPRLEVGKEIITQIVKAIQESWCSMIVISETYAFSSCCLVELAEIVEQRNKRGHEIFPIFYNVEPSDMRYQKGKVEEAFAKHEMRYKGKTDMIKRWRTALTEVAKLKGWHLNGGSESKFIEAIVQNISAKLYQTYSVVLDDLVGTELHLEELHSKIKIGEDDVRIIGICGMGGIGKTTLASVVYSQISRRFEGTSFLADVREVSKTTKNCGLVSLQKQLLSQILKEESFNLFNKHEGNVMISRRLCRKKVLVVIDDVDDIDDLKYLVGRRDWFGSGSRIIITTRDEHLLLSFKVDDVFKPRILNKKESLHLFNLKAFKRDTTLENDFVDLSERVVEYAGGLPLALEVLGSFLCGRDAVQWRSAIERFKKDSKKEIQDRLQISFDGLDEPDKPIFLDIACFFNGEEKNFVIEVLNGCGFNADIGIDVLIKRSLIKVDERNKLRMHHLLQEMGRKIVREKSPDEPGKCCRLWEEKDIDHVITKNTATEAIQGMIIDYKGQLNEMYTLIAEAFLKMKKLRLLKVLHLRNCCRLNYLCNELRLFEWQGYPFKSLPLGFQPDNLVALLLPYSRIEQPWKGNRPLHKLKFVNLSWSHHLIKTPDFTTVPNLKELILEGCTKLVDVHPSISVLRNLKLLNLRYCKSLKRFPEIDGQMECLLELYLDGTGIEELPSSIGHLSKLVLLSLKDCSELVNLPSSLERCKSLKILSLSGCSKVESLPQSLQQVKDLEELDLSETAVRKPPSFIFQFKNLKVLSFNGCKGSPSKYFYRTTTDSMDLILPPLSGLSSLTKLNLSDCNLSEGAIPSDIYRLSSLKQLDLCHNNFMSLPATLSRLSGLQVLLLTNCEQLKSVPELPTSVAHVCIEGCISLEVFADPKIVCDSARGACYLFANCYKLSKICNALTMLKKFIKVFSYTGSFLSILMPGSEIPKWFGHQSDECSIKTPLKTNIWNNNQWMGVAVCCVCVSTSKDSARGTEDKISCSAFIRGRNARQLSGCTIFSSERGYKWSLIKRDHLLLYYWCRDLLTPYPFEDNFGESENLFSTKREDRECDEIFECEFFSYGSLKVKKCGIQIVYEKDLEEMERIKEHFSNPASAGFDDVGLTRNVSALLEQKPYIYDQDAGSSERYFAGETWRPKRPERILTLSSRL